MAPGDRLVAVSRLPYAMYVRYYGLTQDPALDNAVLRAPSRRAARERLAGAEVGTGAIWLLCAVPPPNVHYRSPFDDPQAAVRALAEFRGQSFEPLSSLTQVHETWRVALIRIDDKSATIEFAEPVAPAASAPTTSATRRRRG
jgi:hypothetical protein